MGINQLKAKAYALAGVTTTQQLKANYTAIAALNLRLKVSWQQVVAFLENNPPVQPNLDKTMATLKAEVYTLAGVANTQQLKARYEDFRALNFSYKAAWQTALAQLQAEPSDFQTWLANPPEEYKALFADIESVSADFNAKLDKAKALGQDARTMAEGLEQLAEDAQAEANQLRQEADLAYEVAQRSRLN